MDGRMSCLAIDQKEVLGSLYKHGRKVVNLEEHISLLTKSLEIGFVPKSLKLKNSLPGNKNENRSRLENLSKQAMVDEK
jgi:hypothetical protein